jgi:hypothetical protein
MKVSEGSGVSQQTVALVCVALICGRVGKFKFAGKIKTRLPVAIANQPVFGATSKSLAGETGVPSRPKARTFGTLPTAKN